MSFSSNKKVPGLITDSIIFLLFKEISSNHSLNAIICEYLSLQLNLQPLNFK